MPGHSASHGHQRCCVLTNPIPALTLAPGVQESEVKVEHLQQHFVKFVRNDNLGQISSWLLAHADRDGADCEACDRLAELHSIAVDFPKTGIPASLSIEERRRWVRFNMQLLVGIFQIIAVAIIVVEFACHGRCDEDIRYIMPGFSSASLPSACRGVHSALLSRFKRVAPTHLANYPVMPCVSLVLLCRSILVAFSLCCADAF